MPRDSNNTYTLPEAPFQPNTVAQPTPVNNNFSDIATALTASLTRGETTAFSRSLLDDADAATARGTLAAAPIPTTAATVGEWLLRSSAGSAALLLPAGGTWAYFIWTVDASTGVFTQNFGASIAAGGVTIGPAAAGSYWIGLVWRIA
jgi:hypothetical protein